MTPEVRGNLINSINVNSPEGEPAFRLKTIARGTAAAVWTGFVTLAELVERGLCKIC